MGLNSRIGDVIDILRGIERDWVNEITTELLARTQRNTRVDHGQTKKSWQKEVIGNRGIVGSNYKNALWEEFGTGHYGIGELEHRQTPWYVLVEGYQGTKRPTFNGRVVIVRGRNGKFYYKTNGKKPQRTLYNTFKGYEKTARKRLETLGRRLK